MIDARNEPVDPSFMVAGPVTLVAGATFSTVIAWDWDPVAPSSSVTTTDTVTVFGPSGKLHVTDDAAPSVRPSPLQSHAKV